MEGSSGWLSLRCRIVAVLLALLCHDAAIASAGSGAAARIDHTYSHGDKVPLYANKVGPFNNPSETYDFYDLPFCHPPENINNRTRTIGEVLNGDRMAELPYELNFGEYRTWAPICSRSLSAKDVRKFRDAILNDYYFQLTCDELPMWGFIGKVESDINPQAISLFTHVCFEVKYNNRQVVEINVEMDGGNVVDITEDKETTEVQFLYSVKWRSVETPGFDRRMEKYTRFAYLPKQLEVHWFAVVNACVTIPVVVGILVAVLLRTLKKDILKYSQDEEASEEQAETRGWKSIHGDVFRFPKYKSLFCTLLGCGAQLLVVAILMFTLAVAGLFYPYNCGVVWTVLLPIHALTSAIAGYTSASFYKLMDGSKWRRNILLTGSLFGGPVLLSVCFLNAVAAAYNSTQAKPITSLALITLLWALLAFPLLLAGGLLGRRSSGDFQAPCRTNKHPRAIPTLPWHQWAVPRMVMAGVLPLGAVYSELYYVFRGVWSHKVYMIYGVLVIVFISCVLVTAFVTVVLTYYQLAAEDHNWWWRSVLCGGSTALFLFAYSFHYYYQLADMTGFLQASFYFLFMACAATGSSSCSQPWASGRRCPWCVTCTALSSASSDRWGRGGQRCRRTAGTEERGEDGCSPWLHGVALLGALHLSLCQVRAVTGGGRRRGD